MKKTRIATCALFVLLSILVSLFSIVPVKADGVNNASVLYSTDWLMQPEELNYIQWAFNDIYNLFAQQQIYYYYYWWPWYPWYVEPVYGHLRNYKSQTSTSLVQGQIVDCEANHEFSTAFYFGHMNLRSVGYPYPWYSYGFRWQAAPDAGSANTVWDSDVYYSPTVDNHHFVFLWVCNNGNVGGAENPLYGMPICWTRHNLSLDGYGDPNIPGDPDGSGYSFIGFQEASPTLSEDMIVGGPHGTNKFKHWLVFFYYYALSGYSVHDALWWASWAAGYLGGWLDGANRLSQGDKYWFPGGGGKPAGEYWGKMRIYGDGNIYLPISHEVWSW